jgi:hypothetical protein
MPYQVRAKAGGSVFAVMVETAKEALSKVDELLERGHTDISVRDWAGNIIDPGVLEAEADDA